MAKSAGATILRGGAYKPRTSPYAFQGLTEMGVVSGGTPYGASTLAGRDGSRQPSQVDLDGARYQGKRIAETAAKLFG